MPAIPPFSLLLRNEAFKTLSLASPFTCYIPSPALPAKRACSVEITGRIAVRNIPWKVFSSRLASVSTMDDSQVQPDSSADPSDKKDTLYDYGDHYATRSIEEGFGDRYGDPLNLFKKDDNNESDTGISDQDKNKTNAAAEDKQAPVSGTTYGEEGQKESPKDAVGSKLKES